MSSNVGTAPGEEVAGLARDVTREPQSARGSGLLCAADQPTAGSSPMNFTEDGASAESPSPVSVRSRALQPGDVSLPASSPPPGAGVQTVVWVWGANPHGELSIPPAPVVSIPQKMRVKGVRRLPAPFSRLRAARPPLTRSRFLFPRSPLTHLSHAVQHRNCEPRA